MSDSVPQVSYAYLSTSYLDDLAFAAAWLYKATGWTLLHKTVFHIEEVHDFQKQEPNRCNRGGTLEVSLTWMFYRSFI